MGGWTSNQNTNYKKKTQIMKVKEIRKQWEDFIEEYEQYFISNEENWNNQLNELKKYIDENGKRPSDHDNNEKIKQMSNWTSCQNTNYKKKTKIMKNQDIRTKWEDFIEEYKEYFISNEENWNNQLSELKKYIDENNKLPSTIDNNEKIKQIGTWTSTQNTNYKKKKDIMKNQDIRKKWEDFIEEYKEYFLSNEENWNNQLSELKKYIDENNKLPSTIDNHEKIKQMSNWTSTQNQNYKKKTYIMKNQDIRTKWEDFIEEYKEYFISNEEEWYNNLSELKKYIDENGKRPSYRDKNEKIKQMSQWISTQNTNYKKKTQIMKNKEIRTKWEKFIKEYKEYFLSNEENWNNQLSELKKYIDENNKLPSKHDNNEKIKQMSNWTSNQNTNYKKKTYIMKDKEIRKKWEKFIKEYKEYFN